ncbi:hypothetical protein LguiB_006451 [Lonicera macranthoides]
MFVPPSSIGHESDIQPTDAPGLSPIAALASYLVGGPIVVARAVGDGVATDVKPGSSIASTMIPPYPGSVARTHDRVQALQAYFQQPNNSSPIRTPVMSLTRRSNGHRPVTQVGLVASLFDQTGGVFY